MFDNVSNLFIVVLQRTLYENSKVCEWLG